MTKRNIFLAGIAVIVSGAALVTVGGIALAILYFKVGLFNRTEVATPSSITPLLTDKGNYQTENNWIASTTAQEIAGLAWLISHPEAPPPTFGITAVVEPQKSHVHLEINNWDPGPRVSADLTPVHAWDATGYSPLARQLIGDKKNVEPPAPDTSDLLDDLLTPTGKTLAEKDVQLSRQLLQTPASADLHEKAALLLLTLALREHAEIYSDSRLLLCRATAHLAIAKALRADAPPGWPGKVAEATMLTLAGREVDALRYLETLSRQTDATESAKVWIRVLTLWNKIDWRLETPNGRSPLLLKLAWMNSLAATQWDSAAVSRMEAITPLEKVPDWGRILFQVNGAVGVDVGHRFCQSTIGLEFSELEEVLAAENDPVDKTMKMAKIFNDPIHASVFTSSAGQTNLNIIGPAVFKDISLRHLFSAIRQTHNWMSEKWCVPDEDAQFVSRMRSLFQGVPHERYLTMLLEVKDSSTRPVPTGLQTDLADMPPELAFWTEWREQNCARLVSFYAWGIPFNAPTAMDVRVTISTQIQPGEPHVSPAGPRPPTLSDLMPLAPYSYEIASWMILDKLSHKHPMSKDEEMAVLSPFFDYNVYALTCCMKFAADQIDYDDATVEKILRKECALAPDKYFSLGAFLRKHGRIDEAVEADRQGVKLANDPVLVSVAVQPLVEYDYAHGQEGEAMQLALQASEVYSAGGIETYIWLLCKLNRLDEAEAWTQKEQDRYGGDYLSFFYAAHRDHFPDKYKVAEEKYFPNGLQKVTLASFTDPPKYGTEIMESSEALVRAGLKKGDVVVALDSIAVSGQDAYSFVLKHTEDPNMDLIIWRDGAYQEVKANVPGRRFGVYFRDYPLTR
jgi:hypothetical protein